MAIVRGPPAGRRLTGGHTASRAGSGQRGADLRREGARRSSRRPVDTMADTVKGSSRGIDGGPAKLHLAELLDFRPDQGIIRLHEQRVVILSAAAMGLMRKELVDTLGLETARRVLLRFGFADGYHDAVNLRARSNWRSPADGIRAGAMLHTLEGIVRADVRRVEYDDETGRFEEEVRWHDSYEAEQHVHHYGRSSAPVCWSLVGYSSGFA